MPPRNDEERPLLQGDADGDVDSVQTHESYQVQFSDKDDENPRAWSKKKKLTNVAIISLMALITPLASSAFAPAIAQISEEFMVPEESVIATTTGFIVMMGLGPLVLAPLSETFGRRNLYISCFSIFSLMQIPTALAPNVETLIAVRTISGLFGSVGIANGGGTISDMYEASERAGIIGYYLLGVLLGPTMGPILGGIITTRLNWRWIYWVMLIVAAFNTTVGFFFLRETYGPVLLSRRKARLLKEHEDNDNDQPTRFYFDDEDERPLAQKLKSSLKRPAVIFSQPIVFVMSLYQALIFGTTYSIYTRMQDVFSQEPYNFDSEQVGLLYIGPGIGFLTAVVFIVPRIDTVYNMLTKKHDGQGQPEFRLPLANIGSVLIPIGLFWFGWTAEYRLHWAIIIASTFFYGVGQVVVFNSIQNYYIDSFEKYAASAIAGGAVLRSLAGGAIPLVAPSLFDAVGYGWGLSVFGFLAILIAPSPIIFYIYGRRVRERYPIKL